MLWGRTGKVGVGSPPVMASSHSLTPRQLDWYPQKYVASVNLNKQINQANFLKGCYEKGEKRKVFLETQHIIVRNKRSLKSCEIKPRKSRIWTKKIKAKEIWIMHSMRHRDQSYRSNI